MSVIGVNSFPYTLCVLFKLYILSELSFRYNDIHHFISSSLDFDIAFPDTLFPGTLFLVLVLSCKICIHKIYETAKSLLFLTMFPIFKVGSRMVNIKGEFPYQRYNFGIFTWNKERGNCSPASWTAKTFPHQKM